MIEQFERYFASWPIDVLADKFDMTVAEVERFARTVVFKRKPDHETAVQQLGLYFGGGHSSHIEIRLGLTYEQQERARKAWARAPRARVSDFEGERLRLFKKLYGCRSDNDLAEVFLCSQAVVEQVAQAHKLAKDKSWWAACQGEGETRMPRWSREEVALLRRVYKTRTNTEVAQLLQRSTKSVLSKAHLLGLTKTKAHLRRAGTANIRKRYAQK
mgnify:FL=1